MSVVTGESLGFGPNDLATSARTPSAAPALTIEGLIHEHGAALMRLAYLLTGAHADAEDLWQETFADVHRKWHRVSRSEKPYAYVRAMMLNRHTSSRRRKWHGEQPTDPSAGLMLSQAVADAAERVDSDDALWQLLSTLPTRMRQVLVLRYFEDLDDQAIAAALGLAVSSVRSTASRALAQLRAAEAAPRDGGTRS